MIKLTKSAFFNEPDTKKRLAKFMLHAPTLSMGAETIRFEKTFARKQGRRFAVFVNSGSSANLAVLQALLNAGYLKRGDRIGVSALTWATNVMPVIQLGFKPIIIDCEVDTLNVSPRTLKAHIGDIDALFLTNVLGLSDDIKRISSDCKNNGVVLLEDNCESLGSKTAGRLLGNFGLASTFSFFVGHHLSTIEGGMIVTDDEKLYFALLAARAHGWDRNLPRKEVTRLRRKHKVDSFFGLYTFYDLAFNIRPTDIAGFLGCIQVANWDAVVNRREKNFLSLRQVLDKNSDFIPLRTKQMEIFSNFAVPLICRDRISYKKYRSRFQKAGVEIRPIIVGSLLRQPFIKKYVKLQNRCPNADYIHSHGFYFGNNPELTSGEIHKLKGLLAN